MGSSHGTGSRADRMRIVFPEGAEFVPRPEDFEQNEEMNRCR